jgi:hypothetical protein
MTCNEKQGGGKTLGVFFYHTDLLLFERPPDGPEVGPLLPRHDLL